jgi:hypothetical protein
MPTETPSGSQDDLRERIERLEDALREVYNRANDYRRYIQAYSVVPTEHYAETERRLLAMNAAMDNAMDSAPPPRRFQVEDAERLVPGGA